MDDCNEGAEMQMNREIIGSDSSMDDCNAGAASGRADRPGFRFLYGRL